MTISEATNPEEEHNMTVNNYNKITLNDAVFRLLETCYSIKQGKAIERIDNLLTNLYPTVFDFSITEPYKKGDNNMWERAGWRRCGTTKGGLIVLER